MLINKSKITSIAIGGFDGMHRAHQELFKSLDENGAIVVIESGYANLTPKTYRAEYVDIPIYYYLLSSIKNLSGKEFIKLLKEEFVNLKKIVVGFDFCFGQNRKDCIDSLKIFFDGDVVIIDEVCLDGVAIHSRVIREKLKDGDIKTANNLLGRNYKIYGKQIKGQGLGSKEFVPTINLRVEEFLLPFEGVYITKTILNNKAYNSITFLGHRKTTDEQYAIETHILDEFISNDSFTIAVEFLEFVRTNKRFDDFNELKLQIQKDIELSKKYFIGN